MSIGSDAGMCSSSVGSGRTGSCACCCSCTSSDLGPVMAVLRPPGITQSQGDSTAVTCTVLRSKKSFAAAIDPALCSQGSSPDVVALVEGARALGFEFVGINGTDHTISGYGRQTVTRARRCSCVRVLKPLLPACRAPHQTRWRWSKALVRWALSLWASTAPTTPSALAA